MESSAPLSTLVLILFLSCFAVTATAAQTQWRPGFLYTRSRGRCTPQYWGSRKEAWPRMVPQTSTVAKVFGSRASERFRSDMTLLEATAQDESVENVFHGLLKQTTWEVKTLLIQALVSEEAAALQAEHFSIANEACN
ncbi:hypothetical protein AAG906_015162 [Vitis piasezkii]